MALTEADLQQVRTIVYAEHQRLAQAIAHGAATFAESLNGRLNEMSESLRLMVTGQVMVEKALLHHQGADVEPWQIPADDFPLDDE